MVTFNTRTPFQESKAKGLYHHMNLCGKTSELKIAKSRQEPLKPIWIPKEWQI